MPREFMPHSDNRYYGETMFCCIIALLDIAEKHEWEERLLSDVLKNWPMPNEPVLSEN
jgi:hypothetical protein